MSGIAQIYIYIYIYIYILLSVALHIYIYILALHKYKYYWIHVELKLELNSAKAINFQHNLNKHFKDVLFYRGVRFFMNFSPLTKGLQSPTFILEYITWYHVYLRKLYVSQCNNVNGDWDLEDYNFIKIPIFLFMSQVVYILFFF